METTVRYKAFGDVAGGPPRSFDTLEEAIEFCKTDDFYRGNDRAVVKRVTTTYDEIKGLPILASRSETVWQNN